MNRKTHFDYLILTPFYAFLSLYSFSSFLIVLLLFPTFSSPLLLLLLFSLFRPSSALCESISRRAQTPAPHFLPCGTKSSRSGKDSYILYLTYIPQHVGQHSFRDMQLSCAHMYLFFRVILLQQSNYICHCLSYTYSAVHVTLLNQYVSKVCLLAYIYYSGCWLTSQVGLTEPQTGKEAPYVSVRRSAFEK